MIKTIAQIIVVMCSHLVIIPLIDILIVSLENGYILPFCMNLIEWLEK